MGFDVINDLVKKRFSSVVGAEPKLKWIEFVFKEFRSRSREVERLTISERHFTMYKLFLENGGHSRRFRAQVKKLALSTKHS